MIFYVKDIFGNHLLLFRQLGYHPSPHSDSFIRRLGTGLYPRFHAYLKKDQGRLMIELHLDQKKVSYEGQKAHSGEYDGELLIQEKIRIQQFIDSK
jgi:hypothetical protein